MNEGQLKNFSGGVSVVVNVSFREDISWSVGVDFLASSKTKKHN